mmetsp:Transcript_55951/g.93201  ORF Transcript_55951/g.93201 Transcript_55951/m.93201 type:complete len:276 (-) Transcript_55951:3-830(-)
MASNKSSPRKASIDLAAFQHLPKYLTEGDWSPVSYLFLMVVTAGIIYNTNDALLTIPSFTPTTDIDEGDGWWRFLFFLYGISIIAYMVKSMGIWPMFSFTMMSWSLFTIRYFFSALHHCDFGVPYFFVISEALRFPALVCNSITVTVWWFILVPAIYTFIRFSDHKDKAHRSSMFLKWNFSPMLLNVHLLNLPLCALDHWLHPRSLQLFDLWVALVIAVGYVVFYLFVMDPLGLHFYHVILSPRPHYCFIPYILTLSLFPLFQYGWNSILPSEGN